jgi:predicted acylesterase/phospholipase RssA
LCSRASARATSTRAAWGCAPRRRGSEDFVDFERLKDFDGDFFINAYNLTVNEMAIFRKEEITADHFRAALAFPFIYPPYEINGNFYIEGSAIDPMNFEGLMHHMEQRPDERHAVLVFDMMGAKKLYAHRSMSRGVFEAVRARPLIGLDRAHESGDGRRVAASGNRHQRHLTRHARLDQRPVCSPGMMTEYSGRNAIPMPAMTMV